MNILLKLIFRVFIIFYSSIIGIILVSKLKNIELSDNYISGNIYVIFIITTIILIIASIRINTLRKIENTEKGIFRLAHYIVGITTLIFLVSLTLTSEFGSWINNRIEYENIQNPKRTINHQILDKGTLGFGGERVVETSSFFKIWNTVKKIDTLKLNSKEWKRVERIPQYPFE